jgi:hypothetical protein
MRLSTACIGITDPEGEPWRNLGPGGAPDPQPADASSANCQASSISRIGFYAISSAC